MGRITRSPGGWRAAYGEARMIPARRPGMRDRGQSGATLLEAVVALVILSTVVVVFLSGVSVTSRTALVADETLTAERLAQVNMEWTQNATYTVNATQYAAAPVTVTEENADYSAAISAVPVNDDDSGIQKITVTITRSGVPVFTLEGYKRLQDE